MELEELGRRLREARTAKELTQQQVADHIGVSRATYTHYERGRHAPAPGTVAALSTLFEVPTDFLFYGHPSADDSTTTVPEVKEDPTVTQWEHIADRLADALQRQLTIMEMDKQNERLRIEQVDAVHAEAIKIAQQNMQAVVEEMRHTHGASRSDEGSAQGAS